MNDLSELDSQPPVVVAYLHHCKGGAQMDLHTLQVLEYDKVKHLVGRYLATSLGREQLEALLPDSDLLRVRERMRQTTEARKALDQLLEVPLDPVDDLRPLLAKIVPEGAYLDPREFQLVRRTLNTIRRASEFCSELPSSFEQLHRWGEQLQPQPELEKAIERTIDEEDRVKDSASRELKSIRASIREVQEWMTRKLERMLRHSVFRECLQEPYFTQREGRYVLPVQSKFKARIRGIVHDCSSTGTTTFIEPVEIVEQGNRLRELQAEEEMEVRRILRALSALARKTADPIRWSLAVLGEMDFAYAKGRLSAALNMNEPFLAEGGVLKIHGGKHPLLVEALRDKVVPLDLTLGDTCHAMVLTGPNTGGKTVVLKTLGILCLMAACGLHIPAECDSRIVLYSQIFADIGDEQSLEQNLSTFSSHMMQMSRFLVECNERTLVLLDELGTGTDPVEGGALGVAILSMLCERHAHALVTTHLNELKVYAYETPGVQNGAMEFDQETLEPTYRLLPGTPGSSYALDIASRLGLPAEVITRARGRLEQKGEHAETLLEKLSTDVRQAESARRMAEAEQQKAETLRLELARKLDKTEREKAQILERVRHEARSKLDDLQRSIRQAEEELELLLEQAEQARVEDAQAAKQALEEIRQQQMTLRVEARKTFQATPEKPQWTPVEPERLEPGQQIILQGFSRPGELLAVDLKRKEAEVNFQSVKMRIPLQKILGIMKKEEQSPLVQSTYRVEESAPPEDFPYSLDIHGMTQDEAAPLVERYLDKAHLTGWYQVYIIHGHGAGILRRMVQQILSRHPLVASYRPGDYFEGGQGVTVVRMHKR